MSVHCSGIKYSWDFGDGTSSSLQSPTHTYKTEGLYTVKLNLKHSNGCEDSSKIINAVNIVQTVADFTMSDSFGVCPPLLVQFTNHSINSISAYWDFGDSSSANTHNASHIYTYPGIYTATLYAKGPGGCTSIMKKKITIKGPRGYISYDPLKQCKPYTVNLTIHSTDARSYLWDFNDGNIITGSDSVINHIYVDSGKFLPKMILVDTIGCRVPIIGKDSITNIFATAAFSFPDNPICTGSDLQFKNISNTNDTNPSYSWDFGDGQMSNEKDPVHQYISPGLFYPSLTITTSMGCSGYYRSKDAVKVVPSSNIDIGGVKKGCAPFTTTVYPLEDETGTPFIEWHWDMGNGSIYNIQQPPMQLYKEAGNYKINLTGVNANGCYKSIQRTIEVYPIPSIKLLKDTLLCRGQEVNLTTGGAVKYKWEPALGLNCDTCEAVLAKPNISTKYIFTGENSYGCNSSSSVYVQIKQPLKIAVSQSDKLCYGQSKNLNATGANSYQWTPSIGLNNTSISSPVARPDTTTNYMVVGMDEVGCFKDTGYVKLTVHPIPKVNAGEDKTINIGQQTQIRPLISADVTEVTWSPQTYVISSRNDLPDLTIKPKGKTTYTIEAKNEGGCKATDDVTVFVTCNGNNIFMPTVFSPNNDGLNDIFYPRGSGIYKITNLRIFNRWGQVIFERNNFSANDLSAGWNGTYKGSELQTDTFVYTMQVVCDNNNQLDINGTITLMK